MKLLARALLVLALATGLTAVTEPGPAPASSAPASSAAWLPYTGATFNQPNGTPAQRTLIVNRIHQAIAHTPPGAIIRIATYNLGIDASANLLIAAHRRGVRVQVIVNANLVGPLEARVQRAIGKNPKGSSFLLVCKNACRNPSSAGNMHLKVYSFTRTGSASGLVINSSSNLGGPAMYSQWNDSFAIHGDGQLFLTWVKVFDELRLDRTAPQRRISYVGNGLSSFYQRPVTGTSTKASSGTGDQPYDRLAGVTCLAWPGYGSTTKRTVITVNMYGWYGARGERLARLLALRQRGGCIVRVIGSVMSKEVVRILRGSGIPVKAADWDWGKRLSTSGDKTIVGPRCYSHLKYVTVNGTYRGKGARLVWAGSENWSAPALSSDEVTFEIHDPFVVKAYNDQFTRMWSSSRATHAVNVKTKKRPCG